MTVQSMCITLVDPTEGSAVGAAEMYFTTPLEMTIVGVSACPQADDADATVDINDDGTGVITAVDASDADAPGTWEATGYGGTEDPVVIAAGSDVNIDVNSAANGNAFYVVIYYLAGTQPA